MDDLPSGGPRRPETAPAVPVTPGVEPRFLTLEDVAVYLNVSVAQVYALVRSGELPAIKIGGRGIWRVDVRKLEEFIDRKHEETQDYARQHPLNPRERA